jgi:hypothetical protein
MNLNSLPRKPLPHAATEGAHRVEQLMFFATHEATEVDVRLFRHYSRQLRYLPSSSVLARLWVLLYQPSRDGVHSLDGPSQQAEAGVCAWGDGTLRQAMPLLAQRVSKASRLTHNTNHRAINGRT